MAADNAQIWAAWRHRIEVSCSNDQTVDPDLEQSKSDIKDPQRQSLWGAAASQRWGKHGSQFPGIHMQEPILAANFDHSVVIAQ